MTWFTKELTLSEKKARTQEVLSKLDENGKRLLGILGCANHKDVSIVTCELVRDMSPGFEFIYDKGECSTAEATCELWVGGHGVDWNTAELAFKWLLEAKPERTKVVLGICRERKPGEAFPPDEDC